MEKSFYLVLPRLRDVPADHHQYGYETELAFAEAIHKLFQQWRDQVGECIDMRYGFHRLRFYNCYGGHEDVWFPNFMLRQTAPPKGYSVQDEAEAEIERALDEAFGFD